MSEHAAIALYADTRQFDFSLLLAFGREPNSQHGKTRGVNLYDFNDAPSCAFWNIAYRTVGRAASNLLSTSKLKTICEENRASPIAFADALPIGLKNSEKSKFIKRMAISDSEINEHIEEIFSHRDIINRISIILLSGIHTPEFIRSKHKIKEMASDRKIPTIDVPFFYGTNARKIDSCIENSESDLIRNTMNSFLEKFENGTGE